MVQRRVDDIDKRVWSMEAKPDPKLDVLEEKAESNTAALSEIQEELKPLVRQSKKER